MKIFPCAFPIRLPALALAALALPWNPAAARCQFEPTPMGFVWEAQHLPANARGVLFELPGPGAVYRLRNNRIPGFLMVTRVPPPLPREKFAITEYPGAKPHKAVATRVEMRDALGLPPARIFATSDASLAACAGQNLFSQDGCPELERDVAELLKKGIIYDATQAVKAAYGYFRVGPEGGFTPGREYLIAYFGPGEDNKGVRFTRSLRLSVDRNVLPLLKKGDVALEVAPGPVSPGRPQPSPRVGYRLPEAYRPYLDQLYFATAVALPNRESAPFTSLGNVKAARMLEETGHICDSGATAAVTRKAPAEYPLTLIPECHRARGQAAFLELQEEFVESAVLPVNCP